MKWIALFLAVSSTALADGVDFSLPRHGDIELKLGTYTPWIDKESSLKGATPYADTFGSSPYVNILGGGMLLGEIEGDRYFWDKYGTAGAGFSLGYAEKYALVRTCTTSGGTTTCGANNGTTSDKTSLKVLPLRLLGLYRADYWASHFGFPLVPYVKAGLVFNPWWSGKGTLGTDQVTTPSGQTVSANGAKWGAEIEGGVAFILDFLEPRLAHDFYTDIGVVHTYLFGELTYEAVNNFGTGGLNLSGAYAMFGLAFEY